MSGEKNDKGRRGDYSRREFIKIAAGGSVLGGKMLSSTGLSSDSVVKGESMQVGPGSKYVPKIKAAFVRRKGAYGIMWPGDIYDGEAALKKYQNRLIDAERELGVKIEIRALPIYSEEEAESWAAEAKAEKSDGLVVILLDRQKHSWPTAYKAIETRIPTVVFSPLGTSFTTNTDRTNEMAGGFICSTDEFSQAIYGIRMIKAGAKLRNARIVVIQGFEPKEDEIPNFGVKLCYLPSKTFLEIYKKTPMTDMIKEMADEYIKNATKIAGPSRQDVLNGMKCYVVARNIIEEKGADGITMDCLSALWQEEGGSAIEWWKYDVSLPCIAWSRLNDRGVPAACEADLGAVVKHCLAQYLFDRPGFQQDPVPDTSKKSLIGAHCSCPTRLKGFDKPAEPYFLSFHHGKLDAVPVTRWAIGQKITVFDILFGKRTGGKVPSASIFPVNEDDEQPEMVISTGEVIENKSVPPSGGCVVSINIKIDGVEETSKLITYPGFHQLFVYGDFKDELKGYCELFNMRQTVI